MNKTLKLHDYKGREHFYVIADVEHLYGIVFYRVSGDECALILYANGDHSFLDAGEDGDDPRMLSLGPDDMTVALAANIIWENDHDPITA